MMFRDVCYVITSVAAAAASSLD